MQKKRGKTRAKRSGKTGGRREKSKKEKEDGGRRMKVGRRHRRDGRYAHGTAATLLPARRRRTGLDSFSLAEVTLA